jgi:hypothetical protein
MLQYASVRIFRVCPHVHAFKRRETTLNSDISRPFPTPKSGRIAVKVINHLGGEVMKVSRVE